MKRRAFIPAFMILVLSLPVWADYKEAVAKGDFKTALKELLPLAQKGDAEAQFNLGVMYYNGQGVSQNYAEAVKWLRKAAEHGIPMAQYNLGRMYKEGQGIPQNYVKAYMWWCLAAAKGNSDATTNRDILAKSMTSAQIAEAQKLASEWKPKK